jgi:hypothetical protein
MGADEKMALDKACSKTDFGPLNADRGERLRVSGRLCFQVPACCHNQAGTTSSITSEASPFLPVLLCQL